MNRKNSSTSKILFVGGLLGLLSGLLAAYLLIQKSQDNEQNLSLNAGDGVKVGLGVLGVLKLISDLGDRK
jgi:hypothetical protein